MTILGDLSKLVEPPEPISDADRLEGFVKVSKQVIGAFDVIRDTCERLNQHIETLVEIHNQEVKLLSREIEEFKKENRILNKITKEANDVITKPMKMRTNFTGDFPYHGWKGVGRALEEALDQRDVYRATLEEIQEEYSLRHGPNHSTVKAMIRGVLKMTHRKVDA